MQRTWFAPRSEKRRRSPAKGASRGLFVQQMRGRESRYWILQICTRRQTDQDDTAVTVANDVSVTCPLTPLSCNSARLLSPIALSTYSSGCHYLVESSPRLGPLLMGHSQRLITSSLPQERSVRRWAELTHRRRGCASTATGRVLNRTFFPSSSVLLRVSRPSLDLSKLFTGIRCISGPIVIDVF